MRRHGQKLIEPRVKCCVIEDPIRDSPYEFSPQKRKKIEHKILNKAIQSDRKSTQKKRKRKRRKLLKTYQKKCSDDIVRIRMITYHHYLITRSYAQTRSSIRFLHVFDINGSDHSFLCLYSCAGLESRDDMPLYAVSRTVTESR